MEIALIGINSKYVHTNLAIRKIRAYLEKKNIKVTVKEYSGSEELCKTAADILDKKYDVIGFSCYIWNIEYTLKLAEIIKSAVPGIRLVFGGPEAEFSKERLCRHPAVSAIISGEGEKVFEDIAGGYFAESMSSSPLDMEDMPFPYTAEELQDRQRIFYYESSRGCPFGCSYCLSSAQRGIRYRSVEGTMRDLRIFAENNVRLVKFIDRTFNSNLQRSKDILKGILSLNCSTEFHIEIAADTVDDEFIDILKRFPPNKLRIEAGLQSTNPKTLEAVNRQCNLEKFEKNIRNIIENTNVTLHLDLIAGLPYEDMESFENSFNFAFDLGSQELQLGFLKLLPGTEIAKNAEEFGIKSTSYPPYEIISNKYMSFEDVALLKNIETVFEMYHNSGILKKSKQRLISEFASPFDFYKKLAAYFRKMSLLGTPHHRTRQFDFIYEFARETGIRNFESVLAEDYFISCKGAPVPQWIKSDAEPLRKDIINDVLTDDERISELSELVKTEKRARHKYIRTEKVNGMVWLISYADKKIIDITKYFADE